MKVACDAGPSPLTVVPGKKLKTLTPVRPNAGHRVAYEARLDALLTEMHRSLLWYLRAAYRASPPEMAQDASPARTLQAAFRKLARRWQDRFDKAAPELAEWFAKGAANRSDAALKGILKRAGIAVEFKTTAAMNDVLQASIAQNVSLIKSIAQEHLTQVENSVMRSVQAGRDLGTLTKDIEARYGITRRKAATIALHQNNICTASITRVRQQSIGVTHAIWVHSAGGRKPRPEHVKAGRDKLVYEISKGAYLEGKMVWPGTEINCRCVSRSIVKGFV